MNEHEQAPYNRDAVVDELLGEVRWGKPIADVLTNKVNALTLAQKE